MYVFTGREPHDISMKVARPKGVCALMINQDTAGIYNVTQLPSDTGII